MNLQYSPVFECPSETAVHCRWIFYITHFEIVAMLLEVPSFLLAIYLAVKSPFHYNLTFIGLFMLLGYYVYLVGRFITCLYEIGVLTFTDDENKPERKYPVSLIVSSFLQFFYMGCACGISLAAAFERFFATYFVDTYETRKRKWIPLLVCSELTVTCSLSALIMLFDFLPISIIAFFGVFVSCTAFIFYLVLFMMNHKRLQKIQEERVNDKYTLSVRFQLAENLKVMTLLRNVVIFSGVNNLVMGIILTLYMSKPFQSSHPILTLYLHFAFNMCTILYSFLTLVIMVFSVKQYRVYFFSLRFVRLIMFPIVGKCFPNEFKSNVVAVEKLTISAETDCYFSNLSNQWDKKFDQRISL